jgi:phage N-6-adenine-methyltransferase
MSEKKQLFSWFNSNKFDWNTPRNLYNKLDEEFHFELDPCTTTNNLQTKHYFTKEDDGLKMDWLKLRTFVNPPYGRELIKWVKKCYEESNKGSLVVMLIPARTNTNWFHDYILDNPNAETRFIRGRLCFEGATEKMPFPFVIVIMRTK